ncbi:MAG: tRNA pseudouridine(13) synthase TruD [Nitrososphaerales archaeon]
MIVPAIDRSIGIEVYSTDIQGIAGSIKRSTDHFIVEELLDDTSFDLAANADEEHEYPLYLLQKVGIDSSRAIKEAEVTAGLKFKFVGLKDAKALTKQYASCVRICRDARKHINTKHCTLDLLGYTRRPITKRNLLGNSFSITIMGFLCDGVEQRISKLEEILRRNRIANFYGYQRFGSSRAVTHLVGREIVNRNFNRAVELYLCFPNIYDTKEIMEMREACKDSINFQKVLKIMPAQMDLERILLWELARSKDPVRAIRRLPITIRRLLVQAYQSYLFNRSLSIAIKEGYDIGTPMTRDVCFLFTNGSFIGIKRFDEDNPAVIQLPAIPLPGYAFKDDNRFSSLVKKVMEDEHLEKNDFYVKELQEVSVEGGFRHTSLLGDRFSHSLSESLKLEFILYKGCYATVLLRELMKPEDPIASGF